MAPPHYVSTLAAGGITGVGGRPLPVWDLEEHLALMDRHGIQAAMEELTYALDILGIDGVGLPSSVDRRYMGDAAYDA